MNATPDPDASPSPAPSSLAEAIAAEGGQVTFARFMEMALTHPTLGYYSRAERFLRHGGDFSTAPALSPFFNRSVARLVTELLDGSMAACAAEEPAVGGRPALVARPSIVELGGGEGHLAQGILRFWQAERPELRERVSYRIVEVGTRLRETQAAALAGLSAAGWDIGWGSDLAEACAGTRPVVMVGNEFLDTIPVHLLDVGGATTREAYVRAVEATQAAQAGRAASAGSAQATAPGLAQIWGEVSDAAGAEIEMLFGTLDPRRLATFSQDGILEVFPGLGDLLRQVAALMPSGSLVNFDYGEWFSSPAAADRKSGEPRWGLEDRRRRRRTVRGYFKHQLVLDPLARAGRQDLTADVDFAALDLHGRNEGFETVLFTTLAGFLRGGGAEDELRALRETLAGTASDPLGALQPGVATSEPDPLEADRQATVLANLLDEDDLGGAFKLMVQVRE